MRLPSDPPRIPATSPSGRPTCPSAGPLSAEILLVGESPAAEEIRDQIPFVGRAGRVLNLAIAQTQLVRANLRIVNLVPARAPGSGDDFNQHAPADIAWGQALLRQEIAALPNLKLVVALGNHPLHALYGLSGITRWRGSLFPPEASLTGDRENEYWSQLVRSPSVSLPEDVAFMGTFHPAAVARQYSWRYWLIHDLQEAYRYVSGTRPQPKARRFFLGQPQEAIRLIRDVILPSEHAVAIDTEIDPPIVSLVTEEEAHAFVWDWTVGSDVEVALRDLLTSESVLKVAHNMSHDWRDIEINHGIVVSRPWFDTIGGAHILEPSGFDPGGDRSKKSTSGQLVGKSLSPHIATKFTPWVYHKWMADLDPLLYCALDSVVAYDAYWSQLEAFSHRPELVDLLAEDMALFEVLHNMTRAGFLIDETVRHQEVEALRKKIAALDVSLQDLVTPVIDQALRENRLRKPHLHTHVRTCACCGGGKKKRAACWSCAGFSEAPGKRALRLYLEKVDPQAALQLKAEKATKSAYEAAALKPCEKCLDTADGKVVSRLPFNWDSDDQVADLFYRALRLPPRRYQGSETTRIEQLERMLDDDGLLASPSGPYQEVARDILLLYRDRTRANIDLETLVRLTPGPDGRLRCVFDLWYTPTSRVASREGLLDMGTNAQNIPKESRRLVIPDPGFVFFYPDYKQIEGRALAVLADEHNLKEIYADVDGDSHQAVADLVLQKTGIRISRDQAKRTSFAAFYGIEPDHLSTILGVSPQMARQILNAIHTTFPGARRYKTQVERSLRQSASLTAPTGWRRRWWGYVLHDRGKRKGQLIDKVVKEALASNPQHMGARVLAQGLLQLAQTVDWVQPLVHVHDAGLIQVPRDRAPEAILAVEQAMTVERWGMAFPVEVSPGPNWYVASLSDRDKAALGYDNWTREAILRGA